MFDILCLRFSQEIHSREMNEPLPAAQFLLQGFFFVFFLLYLLL